MPATEANHLVLSVIPCIFIVFRPATICHIVLANPPFAGEIKERKMLSHYDLAQPALKRVSEAKSTYGTKLKVLKEKQKEEAFVRFAQQQNFDFWRAE